MADDCPPRLIAEQRLGGMTAAPLHPRVKDVPDQKPSRRPDIFTDWWLQSFGFALAALYLIYFAILYRAGTWIVDKAGVPIYTDFANAWMAGMQVLHGNAAALYDPGQIAKVQAALFAPTPYFYPNWPYPPTYFLILAPFALLPYAWAFFTWDLVTLLGCVAVVYLIVGRRTAIALTLAAPFTAWNFLAAQNGFLTASLLGASLLSLERRPILAGAFIGCLSYKPQFGILLPVALVASRQWRAIASAAATIAVLAGVSIAAFGAGVWEAFPGQLMAQTGVNFPAGPDASWGYLQSVYGLTRALHGGAALAWAAQGATTLGAGVIVWLVRRSGVRYPLKAATLSAAALLATPYAFAYDMAAIVIPAAFLATDQLDRGLLPGERIIWIAVFGVPLAVLMTLGDKLGGPTFGGTPVSVLAVMLLLAMIVRRFFTSDLRETGSSALLVQQVGGRV
jgi:arabinofuranan 3-O-arabinosyltransferase